MRRLIIHRQRALACFGVPYYCVPGDDIGAVLSMPSGMTPDGVAVANGQTVTILIDEAQPGRFFAAMKNGSRCLVTQPVTIPNGTEDVSFTIITDFDGLRRLQLRIVEGIVPFSG